jgi:hypothetical protein
LGIESGETQQDGVIVVDDIPIGAIVHAWVDRPTELVTPSDLAPATAEVVSSGGRTLTFADANPDTVTASAGSFITDGFLAGMTLAVDSPLNGGNFTIAKVTALVLTVIAADAFAAEGPLSGGETLNGTPNLSQGYLFELAPPPAAFTAGFVGFNRDAFGSVPPYVPSGANPSSRQRVLIATGAGGPSIFEQHEPVWAAFAPTAAGALRQKGKLQHTLTMPGHPSLTPELPANQRNFLRMRWAAIPETAEDLVTGLTADTSASGTWVLGHERLAPGSILATLPTGGGILRDNGKGRLVGPDGDGLVNYITGEWSATFRAAQTGTVLVDYEHGCLYRPLDINLTYDPLQAQ